MATKDEAERRFVRDVVRTAVEKAGSQTALAATLGCSQGAVSLWVSGKKQPAGKTLVRILVYLDFPLHGDGKRGCAA